LLLLSPLLVMLVSNLWLARAKEIIMAQQKQPNNQQPATPHNQRATPSRVAQFVVVVITGPRIFMHKFDELLGDWPDGA